jgi:hypothetical protein
MGKVGARKTMMAVALCLLLPKLVLDVALVVAPSGSS